MKRVGFCCIVTIAIALFSTCNALASWSFHIANEDMDTSWEIWLLTDEELTTNAYALAFGYDHASGSLEWNPENYTNTPADNLMADFPEKPKMPTNGSINNFNAANFTGGNATIVEDMMIGTITLTYDDGRVPTIGDLDWNTSDQLFSVNMDNINYSGTELATTGHLTVMNPVPIPGAIWLFTAGFAGLTGLLQKGSKSFPGSDK
jgi:hypothetical protein